MIRVRAPFVFGLADQAALSLGSILVLIAAAQGLNSQRLGVFALAMATVTLVQSVMRSITGETAIVMTGIRKNGDTQRIVGFSVCVGVGCLALFAMLSLVPLGLELPCTPVGFAILGILFQDAARYHLIVRRRVIKLALVDLAMVAGQFTAVILVVTRTGDVGWTIVAWGAAAVVAGCALAIGEGIDPRVWRGLSWLKDTWRRSSAYATETIVGAIGGYAMLVTIGWATGAQEVAAFRSTISVFGATSLVINYVRSTILRELAEQNLSRRDVLRRAYLHLIAVVAATVVAWTTVLLLLPDSVGVALFTDTWPLITGLIWLGALDRLMASWSIVPTVLLRLRGVTWRATRLRTVVAVVGVVIGPLGAWQGGAAGALLAESLVYAMLAIGLTTLLHDQPDTEATGRSTPGPRAAADPTRRTSRSATRAARNQSERR